MHTESLRLVACAFGDIADVLLANAPSEVLNSYPVLVLTGDYRADENLARRLSGYVAQGGTLIINEADRKKGVLPASLASDLPTPPSNGYTRVRRGRGAFVVLALDQPGQPTAARSLARVLARARQELIPLEVSGTIETLYNRTTNGWDVTLVNNEGVTKTFRDPVVVDPKAAQTVSITSRGRGRISRATLWGADTDQELALRPLRVAVPPGEARIIQLTFQP